MQSCWKVVEKLLKSCWKVVQSSTRLCKVLYCSIYPISTFLTEWVSGWVTWQILEILTHLNTLNYHELPWSNLIYLQLSLITLNYLQLPWITMNYFGLPWIILNSFAKFHISIFLTQWVTDWVSDMADPWDAYASKKSNIQPTNPP